MKNSLPDIHVPGQMAGAIQEAYSALFEAGGSPQKKTRKAIRSLLPPPPGGWDSPARTQDGDSYISARGNGLTWDQVLETHIRGLFFHNSGILEKYEPAVARIAYTELGVWPGDLMDYRQDSPTQVPLNQFKAILRILSGQAHEGEYDFNLNGMSYDELVSKYGKSGNSSAEDAEDTGHLNYRVVRIKNFAEASGYKEYTNNWCICGSKDYWNRYTARGKNTMYFLLAPGFEKLDGSERGEHYPYDRYSLSMIGAVIAPDGSLEYCCLRRNHEGGKLGDHELGERKLGELLGRPVRAALPHVEPEEAPVAGKIAEIKKRLAAGETVLDIYGEPEETLVDGLAQYLVGAENVIVDTATGLPVTDEEASSVTILDSQTVAIQMPTGVNEWDEAVYAWFIYHVPSHHRYLLGYSESDYSDDDYGMAAIDYTSVDDVESTPVPGIYKVFSSGETDAEALFGIREDGGLAMLSGWHVIIDYYENDRVFVMDPSDNQWDSYDDIGLEILRIGEDGSRKLLYQGIPRESSFYTYDRDSRINMIFEDDGDTVYFLHGGGLREDAVPGYCNMLELHGNNCERLVFLEDEEGEEGVVVSLETMRIVAEHIPASPDRRNRERLYNDCTYQLPDGSSNMVTGNGILFDEGQNEIGFIGCPKTPIGKADFNLAIVAVRGKDGSTRFVDTKTRKDIYSKPLPPDAECPYTEELYVGHTENSKYALFDLDSKQVSGEFVKIDPGDPDIVIVDEKAGQYNMVDLVTGHFLFDRPLNGRPYYIGGSDRNADESGTRKNHVSLFRVCMLSREGAKQTLVVGKYTSVKKDGGYMYGYRKLAVSDIGWHDGIEMFPNTGNLVLITDKVPLPEGTMRDGLLREYDVVSRVHDVSTGRTSRPMDMEWMKKKLQELASRDNNLPRGAVYTNMAIAKSVANMTDFITWLDELPRESEDEK